MKLDHSEISKKIAYITINTSGSYLKSIQKGFEEVNLFPEHLIHISARERLKLEFKKYRFSMLSKFFLPMVKRHSFNKKSFSGDEVQINIKNKYKIKFLNSNETVDLIKKNKIKYLINCGAGIFRKKIISVPNLIILNAHAGKLPYYRNMNVVEWAIFNREPVVGTIHRINSGIDTGPIWIEEELDINGSRHLKDAREKSFDLVAKMLGKAVVMNENGLINQIVHRPDLGKNWYQMHQYLKNKANLNLKNGIY